MIITSKAEETIHRHASDEFPNECVGFLYGKEGNHRLISLAKPITNSKDGDQRRRFEISPEDYMKAERFALSEDLDLLGVYHSHPLHPAIPSEHDRKQAVPFFSYVIASVDQERKVVDTTSWRLNDESQFDKEDFKIE
jgi:proteasome lid subunit RPN8/RPN11